jgi:tetratricopeptide (TPR) repeat protein
MSESILWNEMGNLHMRLGSYEDAVSAYGKAIELAPEFSMAYNNLGHAYFSKGDYEGAIPLLKKSIDLSNSAQEQAIAWKRLGDAFQKQGNYDKALYAYKRGDELDALSSVGLINPFANLASDVSPDPIVLEEKVEPEQDGDCVENTIYAAEDSTEDNPVTSKDHSSDLDDDNSGDDPVETLLPAIPPFYPGLEISDEEFQSPDPIQLQTEEIVPIPIEVMDGSTKENIEEDLEFTHWLSSLDQTSSIAIPERKSSGWDDQPTEPVVVRGPRLNSWNNPAQEANYVMLNSGSTSQEIPLFTDQDLWGTQETGNHAQESINTSLAQQQSSVQVLEEEKPKNSSELFKSWRLSDQPEHDPTIWKSMLEALEKKLATEHGQASETLVSQINIEQSPAKKDSVIRVNVSRELLDGIENYKKITSLAPLNDKAWDTLGKLLKDAGEFNDAVDAFQRAISICPNKDLYHYHLGLVFAAQKRHEEAIEVFKQVIEINPEYTLAHCALAGSYRRMGLQAEANSHIKAALPKLDSETEYNRACFEAICGNTDQAIELLQKALDLRQTSPEWVRGDPDLDFIRDDPRFQALVGK